MKKALKPKKAPRLTAQSSPEGLAQPADERIMGNEEIKLLESLISLCDDLAWCRPASEEALYHLTNPLVTSPRLARLAEAFGLMLVRLEARSVELEDMVADLSARNLELDRTRQLLSSRNLFLQETMAGTWQQDPIVGECDALAQVVERALAVSRYPINTMILGPTGSGKEALAKFIFFNSQRRNGNFVAVNCSAIPESLFESEMFGIEKGVATGVDRRRGLIETADGGTLFLDEVGDMSLSCQVKLLRVLEERQVRRVGSREAKEVNLHVISATNAELAQEVQAKRFREDLWYRLNVVELKLPPLKERGSDILLLARHFLKLQAIKLGRLELTMSPQVQLALMAYPWPGNVRELANEMERATALSQGPELSLEDLSEKFKDLDLAQIPSSDTASKSSQAPAAPPYLDIYEKLKNSLKGPEVQALAPSRGPEPRPSGRGRLLRTLSDLAVIEALARNQGNKTKAALELGFSREGLRKRLAKIGPGLARGLKP